MRCSFQLMLERRLWQAARLTRTERDILDELARWRNERVLMAVTSADGRIRHHGRVVGWEQSFKHIEFLTDEGLRIPLEPPEKYRYEPEE